MSSSVIHTPPPRKRQRTTGLRRAALLTGVALACLVPGPWLGLAGAQDLSAFRGPAAGEDPLLSVPTGIGDIAYRLGRGLEVGDTGLNLGGFATLELEQDDGEAGEILLEGINFLVLFEPVPRFRVFSEIELGELFVIDLGPDANRSDPTVEVDRLYGELALSDALAMRVGQFLTPIGRWNQVPAEAFVWTSSEPVLTDLAYEDLTSGAMLRGSFFPAHGVLSYALYGRAFDSIEPDEERPESDHSVGARLETGSDLGEWSVGASLAGFERSGRWDAVAGADAVLRHGPFELTVELEATFRRELPAELDDEDEEEGDGETPGEEDEADDDELEELGGASRARTGADAAPLEEADLWGIYVQGVYELWPELYAVGRYEHLSFSGPRPDLDLVDVGLAWTPLPYLFLKADYRIVDRPSGDVTDGVRASIAVLF